MAAGLVNHDFTTSAGVTFAVQGWVPNTAAPDAALKPIVLLAKSDGTIADPTNMESYLSRLLTGALPKAPGAAAATTGFLIGGTYTAAGVTLTDTQQAGIQLDSHGLLQTATQNGASSYETVAASQTAQVIGATGAAGDYLSHVIVSPALAACGIVEILDDTTSIAKFFGGGTTALVDLRPFKIEIGMKSVAGAWKITTGASVSCTAVGTFT